MRSRRCFSKAELEVYLVINRGRLPVAACPVKEYIAKTSSLCPSPVPAGERHLANQQTLSRGWVRNSKFHRKKEFCSSWYIQYVNSIQLHSIPPKSALKGVYKQNFERLPYSENYRDLSGVNCVRELIRCFYDVNFALLGPASAYIEPWA